MITDHLGTSQLAINSQGQQTWKIHSDAFGNTVLDPNNQITLNLRFPGQYYDQETGLSYNYFRDYNPQIGRYIQSDPIGIMGGINTYNYAKGNPVAYMDAYGENPLLPILGRALGKLLAGALLGKLLLKKIIKPISNYCNKLAGKVANGVKNTAKPKTFSELNSDLISKGFRLKSTSKRGYMTYQHLDGRIVTIKLLVRLSQQNLRLHKMVKNIMKELTMNLID